MISIACRPDTLPRAMELEWVVPERSRQVRGGRGARQILLTSIEQFESFWPNIGSDAPTAPDPHAAGRDSPEMRAIADTINNATKVVFSKTRKDVTWKNSRLVREFDPREIAAMKNQSGNDIMVFGSGSIVSQLTEHALVDEYQFVVSPILLGSGQSLISNVSNLERLSWRHEVPIGNFKLATSGEVCRSTLLCQRNHFRQNMIGTDL